MLYFIGMGYLWKVSHYLSSAIFLQSFTNCVAHVTNGFFTWHLTVVACKVRQMPRINAKGGIGLADEAKPWQTGSAERYPIKHCWNPYIPLQLVCVCFVVVIMKYHEMINFKCWNCVFIGKGFNIICVCIIYTSMYHCIFIMIYV